MYIMTLTVFWFKCCLPLQHERSFSRKRGGGYTKVSFEGPFCVGKSFVDVLYLSFRTHREFHPL